MSSEQQLRDIFTFTSIGIGLGACNTDAEIIYTPYAKQIGLTQTLPILSGQISYSGQVEAFGLRLTSVRTWHLKSDESRDCPQKGSVLVSVRNQLEKGELSAKNCRQLVVVF